MRTHVNTHHIRDYPTKLKFQEHVLVNDRLIASTSTQLPSGNVIEAESRRKTEMNDF